MNEKVIKNWLALSEYDFETARKMLETGRYLYVAFTCQQAVEKLLKAFYVKEHGTTPPYTHNLIKLVESISISSYIDEDKNTLFEDLNSYYIESRYAEELEELSRSLTSKKAEEIFSKTKEVLSWLKSKM